MLFCDAFRNTVEPLSGSGRLISGEYDNSTKPCAVQAILESLMSQDMSDGTPRHTFPLLNIQHSTFHRHSSVPVTADQSTMHTTQGDVKAVQKRTFCRRKNSEHSQPFLHPNIVDSTFHHQPAKTGLSIVWKSKIS